MRKVYILDYNTEMIYRLNVDLSNDIDECAVVETEIENKGFNLDEVSYMITDNELVIEEL